MLAFESLVSSQLCAELENGLLAVLGKDGLALFNFVRWRLFSLEATAAVQVHFFKIKKIYCTNILDHCCFVGIVYFTARESAMLYSSDRTKIKVPDIEGTVKLHDLVILHLPILVICVNFSKSIELRKKCSVVGSISFPLMLILFPPLLKIAFPSYIVI